MFFTRTNAIRSHDLRHIEQDLKNNGIPLLPVELTERAAFRAIVQPGGKIYDLTEGEASKPDAAIENAEAFARAVTFLLADNAGQVLA